MSPSVQVVLIDTEEENIKYAKITKFFLCVCVSLLEDVFYVYISKYVFIFSTWNRVWLGIGDKLHKGRMTLQKESNLTTKASSLQLKIFFLILLKYS